MITLDVSAVVAVLAQTDAHHTRAREILALTTGPLIHTMTLAEVLVGGERIGRVDQMWLRIQEMGITELGQRDDEARELSRLRVATGLKLPDCCVVLCAESTGTGLATFDNRLARAARARGIEVLGAAG